MASFMNGLSAAGGGLASYAASAGLEAQKADAATALQASGGVIQGNLLTQRADLERQQSVLADQMLTTRESGGRVQAAGIAATAAEKSQAAEMARERMKLDADTPEIKLLRALGVPLASTAAPSSGGARSTSAGPDTDNPLVSKHLGLPMPGSDDALRRAIAGGVKNDPKFKDQPDDVQATETKKRLASASASLSSDALDTIADRTLAGDTSALTGLGYGEGGAANRAQAQERITQKLKEQGLTGADLAARIASYSGEKAGARTAGTREANVGMAVTEAQLFMPLALEASKAVPRTQFPTLNSIILAAEQGTGGESVVRLAVATNSLVNAYARAITPSGIPTEGNQTRARELLDKAWADGQYGAAIDQLGKEMKAAKQSPIQQQLEQRNRISGRPQAESASGAASTPGAPPAATPADPLSAARDAISRGAPKDAVIKRLRDNGVDPGGL